VRFKDKVVLITGGASNIGRGAALAFAREGAKVMIADADPLASRDCLAMLQDLTDDCDWVRTDLFREDEIVRMRDATVAAFGGIDVLVNNAGVGGTDAPLERMTPEDWEWAVAGNSRQMFLCCKYVLPVMMERRRGAIVSTATVQAVCVGVQSIAYVVSKAGILGLTRHVALYYGKYGIRANCLCPGHILTPRTKPIFEAANLVPGYPVGRLGKIEDVVEAYLYLASDDAGFLNGAIVMLDGGYSVH
jgi:NAD(P)-dependent dehydrogenase (short-subunit alcohol dehydrogenase family)